MLAAQDGRVSSDGRAAPTAKTFTLVQALRGLAALWVVLFHAAEGGHVPALRRAIPGFADDAAFGLGHYGVSIFFALSGFVIAHSLRDSTPTAGFFGRFVVRRSLRLDPPYWLSIAAVIAFGMLSARVKHEAFAPPPIGHVAAHLAYLQEILRLREIAPVYWTLTFEVQFYLFFVGMLVLAHRIGRRFDGAAVAIALWGVLFLLAVASALGWFDDGPAGLFLPLWKDFFAGALAYCAVTKRWARVMLVLLLVPMMARGAFDEAHLFSRISGLTALGLFLAAASGWAERGLSLRPLQFLGTISYSLYLLHSPVTGATGYIAHRVLGAGLIPDLIALVAILGASLLVAAIFWRVIERPAHHLSRRINLPKARSHDPLMPLPG